jgi:hypothetical protein
MHLGDRVGVVLDPAALLFFDPHTGIRMAGS